ncbi:predicted protein [Micromonas commoda]|uniref:Fructose-bisphosphate aldolase n=1 Tax=Micromonas commoda (strain RCC299 / NOUM17 / CCMP2709) TaxID=296587 RepID=C1EHV8_MICCC|nr:predicted protein [Micromonas commoda]ACO67575.1 predicted protein [Micromonas commoda]|eukprot:XP_002506317.1 predicted protein [Micromonas commoda]
MPRVPSPPASPPAARLAPSPTAAPRNAAPNAFLGGGELFPGATAGELYYEFHAQDGTPETAASAAARHSRAAAASASAAAAAAAARAAMTRAERRAAQLERCRGRTAEQFGSLASRGFIAALDQSGGSTPRALALYGVSDIRAGDKSEMFDAAHAMRTRIVTSEAFDGEKVFGAILFADTAFARLVRGKPTASYLWEDKGIVPFLKIDVGLQPEANGVQLMRDIDDLGVTLSRCGRRDPKLDDDDASSEDTGYPKPPKPLNPGDGDPGLCIFGTKARSVIRSNDPNGIDALVAQQFESWITGWCPSSSPRWTSTAKTRRVRLSASFSYHALTEAPFLSLAQAGAETTLKAALVRHLDILETLADADDAGDQPPTVIFKLTLPEDPALYDSLVADPRVLRVVALSGGYDREESTRRLRTCRGVSASFSRALTEGLRVDMTDEEFDAALGASIGAIYEAACT